MAIVSVKIFGYMPISSIGINIGEMMENSNTVKSLYIRNLLGNPNVMRLYA